MSTIVELRNFYIENGLNQQIAQNIIDTSTSLLLNQRPSKADSDNPLITFYVNKSLKTPLLLQMLPLDPERGIFKKIIQVKALDKKLKCQICLNIMTQPILQSCGCVVCRNCVQEQCVVCQKEVNQCQIHQELYETVKLSQFKCPYGKCKEIGVYLQICLHSQACHHAETDTLRDIVMCQNVGQYYKEQYNALVNIIKQYSINRKTIFDSQFQVSLQQIENLQNLAQTVCGVKIEALSQARSQIESQDSPQVLQLIKQLIQELGSQIKKLVLVNQSLNDRVGGNESVSDHRYDEEINRMSQNQALCDQIFQLQCDLDRLKREKGDLDAQNSQLEKQNKILLEKQKHEESTEVMHLEPVDPDERTQMMINEIQDLQLMLEAEKNKGITLTQQLEKFGTQFQSNQEHVDQLLDSQVSLHESTLVIKEIYNDETTTLKKQIASLDHIIEEQQQKVEQIIKNYDDQLEKQQIDFQKQHLELQNQIFKMQQQLDQKDDHNQKQLIEIAQKHQIILQQNRQESLLQIQRLEQQIIDLKTVNDDLQKQIQCQQLDSQQLRTQIANQLEQLEELKTTNSITEEALIRLKKQFKAEVESRLATTSDIQQIQKQLIEVHQKFGRQMAEISKLEKQNEELKVQNSIIGELRTKIGILEHNSENYLLSKEKIVKLTEFIQYSEQKIKQLTIESEKTQNTNKQLDEFVTQLKKQIITLQESASSKEKHMTAQASSIKLLQDKISDTDIQLHQQESTKVQFEEQLAVLKQQNEQARDEIFRGQQSITQYQSQVSIISQQLKQQASSHQQKLLQHEGEIQNLRNIKNDLSLDLQRKEENILDMQSQITLMEHKIIQLQKLCEQQYNEFVKNQFDFTSPNQSIEASKPDSLECLRLQHQTRLQNDEISKLKTENQVQIEKYSKLVDNSDIITQKQQTNIQELKLQIDKLISQKAEQKSMYVKQISDLELQLLKSDTIHLENNLSITKELKKDISTQPFVKKSMLSIGLSQLLDEYGALQQQEEVRVSGIDDTQLEFWPPM